MTRLISFAVAIWATACTRTGAESGRMDADTARVPPGTLDAAGAEASSLATREAPSSSWHGSYSSQPGRLYVPADWKNVRWDVADSASGLGEGTMRLTLDPAGRIQGVVEGPLGPAVVAGFAADGRLTASVRREHPEDRGFAGVLLGSVGGGHLEGTMRVSPALGEAVRVATFVLSADSAAGR
jgi:hypothetical protein